MRACSQRMVREALHNRQWVCDLRGGLTVQVLLEYLGLSTTRCAGHYYLEMVIFGILLC
uniref:Uncharacterized protein n=1 Tax=Arundo donax TaxID=35708 RepID=A0A0A9BP31_ARUDO